MRLKMLQKFGMTTKHHSAQFLQKSRTFQTILFTVNDTKF